jgi:hypothetical protein
MSSSPWLIKNFQFHHVSGIFHISSPHISVWCSAHYPSSIATVIDSFERGQKRDKSKNPNNGALIRKIYIPLLQSFAASLCNRCLTMSCHCISQVIFRVILHSHFTPSLILPITCLTKCYIVYCRDVYLQWWMMNQNVFVVYMWLGYMDDNNENKHCLKYDRQDKNSKSFLVIVLFTWPFLMTPSNVVHQNYNKKLVQEKLDLFKFFAKIQVALESNKNRIRILFCKIW